MMKLMRRSPLSGAYVTMKVNTTESKINQWDTWKREPGTPLVQDFFNECSPEEREFILTGILPEEWIKLFGEEDSVE